MKKIALLCLFSIVSFLIFTQSSSAQVKFQGGLSGHYSQFMSDDANGIGLSGNLETFIARNFSAGLIVGYHSYSVDKTDLSIYAVGKIYLKSQGFRPFFSFGYGRSRISGTFTKATWSNNEPTYETFEDKITGPGIRVGAGMLYPISSVYSINVGAFIEHQRELPEHVKVHIGFNKLF